MTTVVLHLAQGRAWLMVSLLLFGFAGGMLSVVRELGTGGSDPTGFKALPCPPLMVGHLTSPFWGNDRGPGCTRLIGRTSGLCIKSTYHAEVT